MVRPEVGIVLVLSDLGENMNKQKAFEMLIGIKAGLLARAPDPDLMRKEIRGAVSAAKTDERLKHQRQPEDAFLYRFAFPALYRMVRAELGAEAATQAMLSEYYRNMGDMCQMSPARRVLHPFTKSVGTAPGKVLERWNASSSRLWQACPDFAIRAPFPHKIVFEGKYFEKGGSEAAGRVLVTSIHEAFSYRALPVVGSTNAKSDPGWDYDYACLLAYDASPDGTLAAAWQALPADVRESFWQSGNVFVMVLRGTAGQGRPILVVGAEGGSLSVTKLLTSEQKESFQVRLAEMDYDVEELEPVDEVLGQADSLQGALEIMDRYKWARLTVRDVAPDMEEEVLAAVAAREGDEQRSRWQRRIGGLKS